MYYLSTLLYLGTARVGVDDTRACRRGWVLEPSTSDLMMRSAAVALPLGGGDECKQRRRASRSRPGLSMRRRRIASTTSLPTVEGYRIEFEDLRRNTAGVEHT